MTSLGATLSACQYDEFFFSVYWVGANLSSSNGPVPTGLVLVYFVRSPDTFDQMCSGTIGTPATTWANGTLGCLKVIVTLLPDALTPASCDQTPVVSSAEFFLSRLNVNSTSLAENDWPSLHFTPLRNVNTSVLESVKVCPVAR